MIRALVGLLLILALDGGASRYESQVVSRVLTQPMQAISAALAR